MTKRNQTILIVDEDKETVRSLKENILKTDDNYTVKVSYDGKDALDILEKEKMDLVILDIEVPVMNGLELLMELINKGIWLPIMIITEADIDGKDSKLKEFGIVDFISKPLHPKEIVGRIDEIMKNRKKKDLLKNFGLPSILQLIELEERTGILTMKIGEENGRVFFRNGRLMDVEVKGLSTDKALEKLIHSLYEDREIGIEYINHRKHKKINMSLMQLVMEATRLKDERTITGGRAEPEPKKQAKKKNEDLPALVGLLDSLKEVQSYILTAEQGEVLAGSPGEYNEGILNSSLYLWVTGGGIGSELNLGEPANLVCYLKNSKRVIRKYNDYIIVLELSGITKWSVFKEKLDELLDELLSKK
jgi:DNA-binding response OmpR family regulator